MSKFNLIVNEEIPTSYSHQAVAHPDDFVRFYVNADLTGAKLIQHHSNMLFTDILKVDGVMPNRYDHFDCSAKINEKQIGDLLTIRGGASDMKEFRIMEIRAISLKNPVKCGRCVMIYQLESA